MDAGLDEIIFDDLEWPPTWVSRSLYTYKSSSIGSHMCSITWRHFQWPWVTHNPGFKVTWYLQVEYLKNGAFLGYSY